jgi:hypothetical protein
MTQDEINLDEWVNPDNWHNGRYSSKRDNRVWVPRRSSTTEGYKLREYPTISFLGSTFNYGNPRTLAWIIILSLLPLTALALLILISVTQP